LNNEGIDTIQEHIDIDNNKGEVIWGQFTLNQHQKQFEPAKIKVLDNQVKHGVPTYVFFHSSKKNASEKMYIADYISQYGRKNIPQSDFDLIPTYYHDKVNQDPVPGVLTCKSYVKVKNIREADPDILNYMYSIQDFAHTLREAIDLAPRPKTLLYVVISSGIIADELGQIPEKCLEEAITIDEVDPSVIFRDVPIMGNVNTSKVAGRKGRKTDHIKKAINDKNLGDRGELFVVKVEKKKLMLLGRSDLAEKVEHTSSKYGDGLGYDVKSYELDSLNRVKEIYIEVKTTTKGKTTPFFASKTEIEVSKEKGESYYIYRVYDFDLSIDDGLIFRKSGNILENFLGEPETYSIRIK
jgi:hypothetical protein